jgi:hypothetical protein
VCLGWHHFFPCQFAVVSRNALRCLLSWANWGVREFDPSPRSLGMALGGSCLLLFLQPALCLGWHHFFPCQIVDRQELCALCQPSHCYVLQPPDGVVFSFFSFFSSSLLCSEKNQVRNLPRSFLLPSRWFPTPQKGADRGDQEGEAWRPVGNMVPLGCWWEEGWTHWWIEDIAQWGTGLMPC